MEMSYDRLNTADLRGSSQADYLVSVDAHFRLTSGARVILDEPAFPVLELARSLLMWLQEPNPRDFDFSSMSYEEFGVVTLREVPGGWVCDSVFNGSAPCAPEQLSALVESVRDFTAQVEQDLRSIGVDPRKVLAL